MPVLSLKLLHELDEDDFIQHAVWAALYEPDEFELLAGLGIEAVEVRDQLKALQHPDEYVFPLPIGAATLPLKYRYVRAVVTTSSGSRLTGYVSGPGIAVFKEGVTYYFNRALPDRSMAAASTLGRALGETHSLPLSIEVVPTGERFTFDPR